MSIFVHITFIHAHDSIEDEIKVLREYQFYISNDWAHPSEFVQGCFRFFYDNLRERDER